MARADIISVLYSKSRTALEFNYELLKAPPIYSLLSITDTGDLKHIASSIKYSSNVELKRKYINEIMERRGFKFFVSGTNRIVYKFLEDQSFVAKVAFDRPGLGDNPKEMMNQEYIKPFCCKTFEVSPEGSVGFMERVQPILSREEFSSIAEDVFDLISEKLIGQYVIEDIGTKYFMNFGLRLGWGPVILDYPYIYKLDGDKLYCNSMNMSTGEFCGGEIDYDLGFNNLRCEKCGRVYRAKELEKEEKNNIVIREGRKYKMVVTAKKGNKVVGTIGKMDQSILPVEKFIDPKEKSINMGFTVTTNRSINRICDNEKLAEKIQEAVSTEKTDTKSLDKVMKEIKEESKVEEEVVEKEEDIILPTIIGRPDDEEIFEDEEISDEELAKDPVVAKLLNAVDKMAADDTEEETEEEEEPQSKFNSEEVIVEVGEEAVGVSSKPDTQKKSKRFDPEFYK